MRQIRIALALTTIATLVACGGGGGGSSASTTTTTTPLSSSTFIDSPVQGLYYSGSPSGTTGTTEADGTFKFVDGDTVTFKIGGSSGLEIAASKPSANTPIYVTDLPGGTQIAQVLQSFDTGGDSNTKLDLSKIQSIPASTKTALENHIKDRGDLTTGATVINTALTSIWAATENATSLVGVTKPSAKTEAEVQSHLETSIAKLPKKLPKVAGNAYIAIRDADPTDLSLAAFSEDGKLTAISHDFSALNGTFSVSTDAINLDVTNWESLVGSRSGKEDCKQVITLSENIVGGFKASVKASGVDCTQPDFTEKVYVVDKGFSKDWLKGKTISAEALTEYPDACLPSSWVVNAAGDSVDVTNSSNSNCSPVTFSGKLNAPWATNGYPYVLTVYGTSGNYKIIYVLTKLAGFSDRYATMIFVSTDGGSTYQYNTGRLVKASVK